MNNSKFPQSVKFKTTTHSYNLEFRPVTKKLLDTGVYVYGMPGNICIGTIYQSEIDGEYKFLTNPKVCTPMPGTMLRVIMQIVENGNKFVTEGKQKELEFNKDEKNRHDPEPTLKGGK